jgi:hypothetical protein
MNIKTLSEPVLKGEFDPLFMYHHTTSFNYNLHNLLSILEFPKEYKLKERFEKIESTLEPAFCLDLIHHLNFKNTISVDLEDKSEHHYSRPQILLHLWCLLGCTDSLEYIANYLELSIAEVKELICDLHNTFSIDSLVSRIQGYYEQNKHIRESPELYKRSELLGIEPILEPKDTGEARKQRLQRRGECDIKVDKEFRCATE